MIGQIISIEPCHGALYMNYSNPRWLNFGGKCCSFFIRKIIWTLSHPPPHLTLTCAKVAPSISFTPLFWLRFTTCIHTGPTSCQTPPTTITMTPPPMTFLRNWRLQVSSDNSRLLGSDNNGSDMGFHNFNTMYCIISTECVYTNACMCCLVTLDM